MADTVQLSIPIPSPPCPISGADVQIIKNIVIVMRYALSFEPINPNRNRCGILKYRPA